MSQAAEVDSAAQGGNTAEDAWLNDLVAMTVADLHIINIPSQVVSKFAAQVLFQPCLSELRSDLGQNTYQVSPGARFAQMVLRALLNYLSPTFSQPLSFQD